MGNSFYFRPLNKIFSFPAEDAEYGIEYALKKYVGKIIPSDISPADYDLYLLDLDGMNNFIFDELEEKAFAGKNNFFALVLNSQRKIYDIGSKLERIETRFPDCGKYLLSLVGGAGVDCLTPARLWEEGDRYFSWCFEENTWDSPGDYCAVTPKRFQEYYPVWAYADPVRKTPEKLADVPEVEDYKKACSDYLNFPGYRGGSGIPGRICPVLPGAISSPAVIGWTKGRNELELDPAVIASDEEINCFNECEGCNPGAEIFEFFLRDRFADWNLHEKKRFDLFLEILSTFENLMEWIKKAGAE